jgi:hypothetical protein
MRNLIPILLAVVVLSSGCDFDLCVSGDCENGYGTYAYSGEWEGDKYLGEWKDGKRHGQGTYTYASGDKYAGEFKDGMMHGQGTYTYGLGEWEGDKYVGEFKDDMMHGQGTYTEANGTVHIVLCEEGQISIEATSR